jgi:hypothetical protein
MGSIQWGRVVVGGIIAGIVINIGEFVLNTMVVGEQWASGMEALGGSVADQSMAVWTFYSLLQGLFCVWLYAAIRPRYGAGPKTAVCAGLAAWFGTCFFLTLAVWNLAIFATPLLVTTLIWALVELPLATVAGAWFYREA